MNQPIPRVGWALLGVCCLLSGVLASSSIPLDSHEILVAETAQEMIQRGDWIVPYFNGQPRLDKPPVSYWATAAIASVAAALTALGSNSPLVAWGVSPTVYVCYSERRVANLVGTAALDHRLRQSPTQELGLVTRAPDLAALSGRFQVRELGRYHCGDSDDVLVVLSTAHTLRTPALERGSASP